MKNSTKNTAESNFCKVGREKRKNAFSLLNFNENEKSAENLSLHFFILEKCKLGERLPIIICENQCFSNDYRLVMIIILRIA